MVFFLHRLFAEQRSFSAAALSDPPAQAPAAPEAAPGAADAPRLARPQAPRWNTLPPEVWGEISRQMPLPAPPQECHRTELPRSRWPFWAATPKPSASARPLNDHQSMGLAIPGFWALSKSYNPQITDNVVSFRVRSFVRYPTATLTADDVGYCASAKRVDLDGFSVLRTSVECSPLQKVARFNQASVLLPRLQELDFGFNHLNDTAMGHLAFNQLSQLRKFSLSANELRQVPEGIGACTALEKLSLFGNRIAALSPELCALPLLAELRMANNVLRVLPPAINLMQRLVKLDLAQNSLEALPEELCELAALQELDVSDNNLTALPAGIGQLASLRKLDAAHNALHALPESFVRLTKLETLNLSRNELVVWPVQLFRLTSVQALDLHSTKLRAVPRQVANLVALRTLHVAYNELGELPADLDKLVALQKLHVDAALVPTLPPTLRARDGLEIVARGRARPAF